MRSNKINHLGLSLFTAVRIFSLFSILLFIACSGGGNNSDTPQSENVNKPPQVNMGENQTISLPTNSVQLNATVTDDSLPEGSTLTYTWVQESGPETLTFNDSDELHPTVTFNTEGIYIFQLSVSDGELSASDTITITVNEATQNNLAPESPSHLTAYALSSSEINLTWYDNSDNETGFIIERALNNTFDTTDSIEVNANLTSYIDTDLAADTLYFYRISAINGIGASNNTDSVDCRSNSNNSNPLALTPIARFDVVPYQRISVGETFNLGVIAFSKNGINRVEFNISGQGYSGTNPLVSNEMTYNSRTDVYEYWVPLQAGDFETDGTFTVQASVYGKNSGLRNLEALQLLVNAGSSLPKPEAWVSSSVDNGTGVVGDSSHPFRTITGAISGIQTSNGGTSDGAVIYLHEGTYSFAGVNPNTSDEWFTITKAIGASKEATIVNTGGPTTTLLKVDGISIRSQGHSQRVISSDHVTTLWVNNCDISGLGRWEPLSNPIEHSSQYSTNNYVHDVDYGYRLVSMVRGTTLERLGNDVFQNSQFLVNITVNDVDNGETGWHSDAYQVYTTHTPPAENRIIYNYKATDLHVSGFFAQSPAGIARNVAFVNVFFEMREPFGRNEINEAVHDSWDMYDNWDHLLLWHCSLPTSNSGFTAPLVNSSFIGNLFRQYIDYSTDEGDPVVLQAVPGNSSNNDFLYNHVMHVSGVTPQGQQTPYDLVRNQPVPHWFTKLPDSSANGSATTGSGVVDVSDPGSVDFGRPLNGSVLIDRIPFSTVPADIYGNQRDQNPDVGAIEY